MLTMMMEVTFLLAYLFWSNCLNFSLAQDQCPIGSFYENRNNFNEFELSMIDTGSWYLNLEFPSSCSGRVYKYEVMHFQSGPGSGQTPTVTVSLWNPASDQNGMYNIIPGSSLELSRTGRGRRRRSGSNDAEEGSPPMDLYVRKGAIIGVYYRPNTQILRVIGQETPSSNDRMVCKRAGSLDDNQSVNCTSSLDTDLLIFAEATIDIVKCPNAPTILNGISTYIDGDREYGARAQYNCNEGHEIGGDGNNVLVCEDSDDSEESDGSDENGEWGGTVPSCQPVTCPILDTPVNGTKHGSSYVFESLVMFSCDTGFLLEGDHSLVCQSDGTWNGSIPMCVPVTCGYPGNIDEGTVLGNSFDFGDVLKFICNESYSLVGPSTIMCQSNGKWSEELPTCSIIQCQFPESPTNGVAMGTTTVNSVFTFSCNNGYALFGNDSSICMTNGQWSNESPECIKECRRFTTNILTVIPNVDTYIVGDTVTLTCITDPVKQTTLMCTSSGFWNGSKPMCLELTETSNVLTLSTVDAQTVNRNNNSDSIVVGSVIAVILVIALASVLATVIGLLILWRKRRRIIFKGGKSINAERDMLQETLVGLINHTYQDTSILVSKDFNNPLYGDVEEETTYSAPFHPPEITASYSIYEACGDPTIYDYATDEAIYWEPGSNIQTIYEQLATRNYKSIPRQQIKAVNHLGSGRFGTVDKGLWSTPEGQVAVAIKTLKGSSTEEEEVKFLQEAAINGQFNHPNIVRLCGVVTEGHPTLIILEYLPNGDLKAFLENLRPAPGELPHDSLSKLLLKFSHEVACGMLYLSRKGFVHRDLAARNILVGEGNICKIADFGMSRDLQEEDYYRPSSRHISIPIKWTAPEAINFHKYSTQSDVWSFGVVLYEIWSVGHKPFERTTNQECIRLIESGYRLPAPFGCSRSVYEIMMNCWNPDPSCRPKFIELEIQLRQSNEDLLDVHENAHQLGGDPEGSSLHTDLQNVYEENPN